MSQHWIAVAESAFPWEMAALRYLRERLPEQEPFHAWANFESLTGSKALAAYGDVDGPSAANNRPWSRTGTATLLRRSDASASAHDYVGTHSVQRAGAGSVG